MELWANPPNGPWTLIAYIYSPTASDPDGALQITLKPGQVYELGVYYAGFGPNTPEPRLYEKLDILATLGPAELIEATDVAFGGTWVTLETHTPPFETRAYGVVYGQPPPPMFQLLGASGGIGVGSVQPKKFHKLFFVPLVPGQQYYWDLLVVDKMGRWQRVQDSFITLGRKVTVEFPTVHIYNDGDESTKGAAKFSIEVMAGSAGNPKTILKQFKTPEMEIDDWGETDRPYSLGYAYIEYDSAPVPPDRTQIMVRSQGHEEDDPFGEDIAGSNLNGVPLSLPVGLSENVVGTLTIDCRPQNPGSSFHYGLDVKYSATYS